MNYFNPILQSDFSDPDVIRDGDDFYMVSSSFNYNPAIPVLHSKNLVEWELIGYALNQLPLEEFKQVIHGGGVWAPSLRKHGNTFYCVFPIYGRGIWACKTDDIRGEWSKPWQIYGFEGAEDPCPIWTDDGKCYLAIAFAKSKAGFNSKIAILQVAPDLSGTLSENYTIVYDGCNDNPCIEGPKFYTHGGYIYIYAPAGGVKHGWQTALRAKDIFGPYESKIVMSRGDSEINGPHQGALVDLPDGKWAFIHFRDMDAYGRVTYLQPAEWVNDWCLCGKITDERLCGTPEISGEYPVNLQTGYEISYNDDFKNGISPVWQTPAVCGSDWYFAKDGLKIFADESPLYSRAKMLSARFPSFCFYAETEADVSALDGFAALCVYGAKSYSLCLGRGEITVREDGEGEGKVVYSQKHRKSTAKLGVCVHKVASERARVYFTVDGKRLDGVYAACKDRWTGARLALYADGKGEALFKYFKTEPEKNSTPIFVAADRS